MEEQFHLTIFYTNQLKIEFSFDILLELKNSVLNYTIGFR